MSHVTGRGIELDRLALTALARSSRPRAGGRVRRGRSAPSDKVASFVRRGGGTCVAVGARWPLRDIGARSVGAVVK
jgi:hypothetical protein